MVPSLRGLKAGAHCECLQCFDAELANTLVVLLQNLMGGMWGVRAGPGGGAEVPPHPLHPRQGWALRGVPVGCSAGAGALPGRPLFIHLPPPWVGPMRQLFPSIHLEYLTKASMLLVRP